MRIYKWALVGLLAFSVLAFLPGEGGFSPSGFVPAANSTGSAEIAGNTDTIGNGEYAITGYKINIEVNENNTFCITETITANFNVPKLGIYRKIPLANTVVRLDGTTARNRAKVSDITGTQIYKTYSSEGNMVIELGEPDGGTRSTGSKEYTISYLYDIGKDTGKGYDEFYFNIIGPEWDTAISNIEFAISMPKDFDASRLGFSSGPQGSTTNNIDYEVEGNVITGRYNGVLDAGEAISVRLELPDGYFAGAKNNYRLMMVLAIVLPIVFAGVTFIIWARFGRDEKPVETVEFYPPEGFNSAEVGFLYRGKAETIDVVSLLVYLANKGYIRIEETEEKALFSKTKGFRVTKAKEYDGNNANERLFLAGLFAKTITAPASSLKEAIAMAKNPQATNESTVEMQSVTSADLQNSFYTTLNAIVGSLNSKDNREKIFEKSSLNKYYIAAILVIATFVLISCKPVTEFGGPEALAVALLFPGIGFSVLIGALTGAIKMPKVFALVWGGLFGGVPWCFAVLPALLADGMYMLAYTVGIASIATMFVFARYFTKRTPYGNELLGKIQGFRNFLETAEKPKLEELVMHNPSYFFNILPFTYVLGVSDKWIKKFETIATQPPDWYGGTDGFSAASFGSFVSSTMASASASMSSSPGGGSSGGGSSGGGSSGGGSGGGGGGSR